MFFFLRQIAACGAGLGYSIVDQKCDVKKAPLLEPNDTEVRMNVLPNSAPGHAQDIYLHLINFAIQVKTAG